MAKKTDVKQSKMSDREIAYTRDCIWGSVMVEEQYDSPESKAMWTKFEESIHIVQEYQRKQNRIGYIICFAQMFGTWLLIMSSIALLIILFR